MHLTRDSEVPLLGRRYLLAWRFVSPSCYEAPVLLLCQTEPGSFFVSPDLQAVSACGTRLVAAATRRMPGLQLEVAQLPLKERGSRPSVVLVLRQHVPDQNSQLPGGGDGGHLLASP